MIWPKPTFPPLLCTFLTYSPLFAQNLEHSGASALITLQTQPPLQNAQRHRYITSGQDGGIGRQTFSPRTAKRRTNLKRKHNQKCQKIKLYRSLTTRVKKDTFIQTGRRGRDGQLGWRGCAARQQLEDQWSHICMQINWQEQLGSETDHTTQGSNMGKESLKTSGCKNLQGLQKWERLPASQESSLERPTGSQNVHKPTHLGISTRSAQFDCGQWGK